MKRLSLAFISLLAAAITATAVSPLASGHWAKVAIDTTGVYELSYDELRSLGFGNPERVRVYGSGGVEAANHSFSGAYGNGFSPTPSMHTDDGRVLFFGEGPVRVVPGTSGSMTLSRNFYDDKAFYFLSDSGNDTCDMPRTESTGDSESTASHLHVSFVDRQLHSPGRGGAIFLSNPIGATGSDDYGFFFADYDHDSEQTAWLYCEYGMHNNVRSALRFETSGGLTCQTSSGPTVAPVTTSTELYKRSYVKASFSVDEGVEQGTFSFRAPEGFGGKLCAVDYVYMAYPRRNVAGESGALIMNYTSEPGSVRIEGFGSTPEVWDVTAVTDPRRCSVDMSADGRYATAGVASSDRRAVRLVAFNPSAAQRRVLAATAIENGDLASASVPDILIICAPALRAQAEELAALHRSNQGLQVLVASQDRVFDEFSEGSRTPMAFRRLAKQLYDREPGRLKHIILYGSASYYNLLLDNAGSALVSFQAESTEECRYNCYNYCGDQYFGMLGADYDHSRVIYMPMTVNVGRIPAASPAAGAAYNEKVRRLFGSGPRPDAFLRAIMYSDTGNKYQHLEQNNEACEALAQNPLMTVGRLDSYFYDYDKTSCSYPGMEMAAAAALARGTGFVGYAGHGSRNGMGEVMTRRTVDGCSYEPTAFGMFASCEVFPFDYSGYNVASHMLERVDGGLLCLLAAGRTVVLSYNRKLGTAIAKCYAELKPGDTYGDLLRRARSSLLSQSSSVCRNTMCYNFGGDPALPVPVPEYGIVLDSEADGEFVPRVGKELRGSVVDAEGRIVDNFDGTVALTLYCAPVEKVNLTDTEERRTASDGNEVLAMGVAEVSAGRFSAVLTIPATGSKSEDNRLVMTAVDAAGRCAAGVDAGMSISDADIADAYVDMTPPTIVDMYIDDDGFEPGDRVAPSFVLHVDIDASPSGLRTVAGLERSVKLMLDGDRSYAAAAQLVKLEPDSMAHIALPVENMAQGKHTFSIEVANNAGVKAFRSIDFVVGSDPVLVSLVCDAGDSAAVRDDVCFSLGDTDTVSGARLIVVDRRGRTVLSEPSCTFPYTWNLVGNDGRRVPDGLYRAWIMMPGGSSDAVQFTVLRAVADNK